MAEETAILSRKSMVGKLFSLPFVLNVPYVFILIASIGLTSYLSFQNSAKTVNDIAHQMLSETAARVNQYLDSYLTVPFTVNEFNQDAIRSGQLNLDDPLAIERHFLPQMRRFENIAAITWANEQAEYFGLVRDTLNVDLLYAESSESTGYALTSYETTYEADHLRLLSTYPNYDPRERPWYKSAVNTGQLTWTRIFVWSNESGIGLDAVAPVYEENGDLRGVLDVSLFLSEISVFLQNIPLSEHGNIAIVDEAGMLVASSSILQPYVTGDTGIERLTLNNVADPRIQALDQTVLNDLHGWAMVETPQQIAFDVRDKHHFAHITPYQSAGLNWWIAVIIPEAHYMTSLNNYNRYIALLAAGSIAISTLLISFVARWITTPILQLNRGMKTVAAGNLSERLYVNRQDEIGELVISFNQMAEQLQTSSASLQASESRLQAIFDNSPDAILVSNLDTQIIGNPAFLSLFGYKNIEAMRQKPVLDNIAPDERERVADYIRKRAAGEPIPTRYETYGRKQDGTTFDMEVWVTTFYQNMELVSLGILRDVTERKKAQADVLKSSQLLAHQKYELSERVKELHCLYQHSKILERHDLSVDELAQQTIDLMPTAWQFPDITCVRLRLYEQVYVTQGFKETLWTQTSAVIIDHIQVGLLEIFYVEEPSKSSGRVFLEEEQLLIEEITRRLGHKLKALEAEASLQSAYATLEQKVVNRTEQLNRAKEQVEAILNSSVDGIMLINPDLTIQRTNDAFDKLFTCEPNAYLNRHFSELFPGEDYTNLKQAIQTLETPSSEFYITVLALRSDNTLFDAELSIGTIEGAELVCVVRDITTRKAAEISLRQTLAREKELGELKTRFVSMASHEFRTPLATILALSETLDAYRHKMEQDEIQECLDNIKAQVAQLKGLVEDVLLLARIQARRHKFNPVKQDVIAVIKSIVQDHQDIKNRLNLLCDQEYCEALLDSKLIRQIVGNLVSNALKYSSEDQPVHLHLECLPDAFELRIQDFGIGIPGGDLKHLFEPFYRASNASEIPGTGLGLVITKEAIELHGGTLHVESYLNTGTTFIIHIPLLTKDEVQNGKDTGH